MRHIKGSACEHDVMDIHETYLRDKVCERFLREKHTEHRRRRFAFIDHQSRCGTFYVTSCGRDNGNVSILAKNAQRVHFLFIYYYF